jgi:CDP-diacylglycerol--serine O-phosphatidyltransferase
VDSLISTAARPAQIEDPGNLWLVHPLADRLLAPALRLDIHPNTVSFAGMGCGALAGLCYWHWQQPMFVAIGFLAMVAWHIMDGLDGKLARASGKASPLGRVIDGLCDYFVFILVLVPLALSLPDWQGALMLALASGACHAVQSAWYEGEREAWKRRARGIFAGEQRAATGSGIEAGYNWIEQRLGSGTRDVDRHLASNPGLLPAYLEKTAPLLRQLSVLSANNRTIAIALACFAGNPRLYWYWEIFVLTFVAAFMAWRLRNQDSKIDRTAIMSVAASQAGE